jgi:hypothetical protein
MHERIRGSARREWMTVTATVIIGVAGVAACQPAGGDGGRPVGWHGNAGGSPRVGATARAGAEKDTVSSAGASAGATTSAATGAAAKATAAPGPAVTGSFGVAAGGAAAAGVGVAVTGHPLASAMAGVPAVLRDRPAARVVAVTGHVVDGVGGLLDRLVLVDAGERVTLTGQGYIRVQWAAGTSAGQGGEPVMPTWTALTGTLLHVASAGRVQLTEYYYLDGTVTLRDNAGAAVQRLGVTPVTWAQVRADVNQAPDPAHGIVRHGVVLDAVS